MRVLTIIAALTLAACGHASEVHSALQCQQRVVDAREAKPVKADPFGAAAYEKLDRSGCSANQIADIDKLYKAGVELNALSQANEDAAASGNEAAHMQAFQKFNNALIGYDELQQTASAKLKQMQASVPQ